MAREKKGFDIMNYLVKPGERLRLKDRGTKCDAKVDRREVEEELFPAVVEEMKELQERLYAQGTYGLVVVLQAMDAAGKDSAVKRVFSAINPAGVNVVSFKQPTSEENDHDFLWRINKALPARGHIGIFNRSHYEEVIVTRIHDLLKKENLPSELGGDKVWKTRYEDIVNWERYLSHNGFPMVKIFLHLSKEEQQERLFDRIFNQEKNWKLSLSDLTERRNWDDYQRLYEEVITETTSLEAPWFVVPADNKWFARYVIACVTLKAMRMIDPRYPELSEEAARQIDQFKALLKMIDIDEIARAKAAAGRILQDGDK